MRPIYLLACVLAAAIPWLPRPESKRPPLESFPGWPSEIDGRPIRLLPKSERDTPWSGGFPGRVARFTDGEREIVIRWVTESTRKLHPARMCFQGLGYEVRMAPDRVDRDGSRWGAFVATRGSERLWVVERIRDGRGRTWSDQSAWYWAALLGRTDGPWWVVTIAERR